VRFGGPRPVKWWTLTHRHPRFHGIAARSSPGVLPRSSASSRALDSKLKSRLSATCHSSPALGGADHPDQRGAIREDPHDVGPSLDLLVQPLQRVGAQLAPVLWGESPRGPGGPRRRPRAAPQAEGTGFDDAGHLVCGAIAEGCSGWTKMVRTIAARVPWAVWGRVEQVRIKWTRHSAMWPRPAP
jgi:hypothetical protein